LLKQQFFLVIESHRTLCQVIKQVFRAQVWESYSWTIEKLFFVFFDPKCPRNNVCQIISWNFLEQNFELRILQVKIAILHNFGKWNFLSHNFGAFGFSIFFLHLEKFALSKHVQLYLTFPIVQPHLPSTVSCSHWNSSFV
jgi:hypothetical protein